MALRKSNTGVPLTGADSAWLQMEHPDSLMMITSLFRFRGCPDPNRVRELLLERFCSYDRFRMRVTATRALGTARWEFDPDFHIDRHFSVDTRERPLSESELLEHISQTMSTPLDRHRPLWQMQLVSPVEGGSALVVRLHHAIADGIALMRVLLKLVDEPMESLSEPAAPASRRAQQGKWGARLPGEARVALNPARILDLAVEAASALTKLVSKRADPPSPLKGPLGRPKRAALTRPLALDTVKAVSKSLGGTVNDILMAALSGALSRYLHERGKDVKRVRVVVPVDLRDPRDRDELGNKFGMVFLSLPIGHLTVPERMAIIKRRMDRLKRSPEAVVVFGILHSVGGLPVEFEKRLVELFGSKATAVVTNVPGPSERLSLAGTLIEGLMFWVPQSGRLGLGISILSYGGQVRVGVASDAGLIPHPEELAGHFEAAFQELEQAAATSSLSSP